MRALPARFEAARVESEARSFWAGRSLPPKPVPLGPGSGPGVALIAAALHPSEGRLASLQRAIRADISGRRAMQLGLRVAAPLLQRGDDDVLAATNVDLERAGVWLNGARASSTAELAPPARLAAMVSRLAEAGVIVARDAPMRTCPSCRTPRTPQTIVYEEREGPGYLIRFALEGDLAGTSLLVWTDAAWKLLGAPAVAVNAAATYVQVRFRRRGADEMLLIARAALPRLAVWMEGAAIEVLGERPGSALAGRRFTHPLSVEFPALGALPPPAGCLVASDAVEDRGTGAVALVPFHGASDHAVAQPLGISGWPVVGADGALTRDLAHKYVGLPLDSAESFVLRDLEDSGRLFLQLRVRRGVPYCGLCGSELLWFPGRAWCLDLPHLPPEATALFRRLLPPGRPFPRTDVVAWPLSASEADGAPGALELSECAGCGRTRSPPGPTVCDCGGTPRRLRRRLLPAFEEALAQWAAVEPLPPEGSTRLYAPARNAAPALLHDLLGWAALPAHSTDVRFFLLPTLPRDLDRTDLLASGVDALRGTVARLTETPEGGVAGLVARQAEEERRLHKLWQLAHELLEAATSELGLDGTGASPAAAAAEEDRAVLARLERMRREVSGLYEREEVAAVHARLWSFLEREVRTGYIALVRSRLEAGAPTEARLSALRTLLKVLADWTTLYAPIAPHTMEVLYTSLTGGRASVFERDAPAAPDSVLDERLERAFEGWRDAVAALRQYRREAALPTDAALPLVVLAVDDEASAADLRAHSETLARLLRADRLEVASPERPWEGRRILARPILEEIQRAYPAQARRIVRILEGMQGRRIQEGIAAGNLEIALEGQSVPVTANMVELAESLPAGVVAVPWALGDLLVQPPLDGATGATAAMPALSPDGFRFLRTLQRRLGTSERPSAVDRVVVAAHGALSEELKRHHTALSEQLEGRAIELVTDTEGFVGAETLHGRSGRGDRWSVWAPGLVLRQRGPKTVGAAERVPRVRSARAGPPSAPEAGPVLEFLGDEVREREATVQAMVVAFDRELGRPVIGPSKLQAAWDAGLQSFDQVAHARYDQLEQIPGFGPTVAAFVVRHFGGTVPPRPARTRRWTVEVAERAGPHLEASSTAFEPPSRPTPPPPRALPPSPAPLAGQVGSLDEPAPEAKPTLDAAVSPAAASPSPIASDLPQGATAPSGPSVTPASPATSPPLTSDVVIAPVPGVARIAPVATPRAATDPPTGPTGPERVATPTPARVTVTPVAPPESVAGPAPGVELWPEGTTDSAWSAFLEATGAGHRGVCVTREFPDRLRAFLGTRDVEVFWLSNLGRDRAVRPADLDGLLELLRRLLGERSVTAVYLDGIEYLLRIHGLDRTRRFLQDLEVELHVRDARAWVPINPALVEPASIEALEASFRLRSGAASNGAAR